MKAGVSIIMEKYKPEYLGKIIPVNDPLKMTNFIQNQYDSFSKIFDVCKNESASIKDITLVNSEILNNSLSVKLSTTMESIEKINTFIKDNGSISINGDIITATA